MAQEMNPEYTGASSAPTGRAGFWRRFVAAFIDGFLIGIVSYLVSALLGLDPQQSASSAEIEIQILNAQNLVSTVLSVIYFGLLEGGSTGQTLGKRAMGIRVCDIRSGEPIGVPRAIGRYFARFLSAIPFLLGYFWMLWDKEKQTWHDKMTGAVVVPASDTPVEQTAA